MRVARGGDCEVLHRPPGWVLPLITDGTTA
jgi:hypothetical protein